VKYHALKRRGFLQVFRTPNRSKKKYSFDHWLYVAINQHSKERYFPVHKGFPIESKFPDKARYIVVTTRVSSHDQKQKGDLDREIDKARQFCYLNLPKKNSNLHLSGCRQRFKYQIWFVPKITSIHKD